MRAIADILFSSIILLVIVLTLVICDIASASEPSFCSVDYFIKHELPTNQPKAKRLRCFLIGKLTLCGVAIGASDAAELAAMSPAKASDKHCTWYFNSGNREAEKVFHHTHLVGPYMSWAPWISREDIANDFERVLNPQLGLMLSCAEKYQYIAGGCNGQRHRGPSEFAWFLSVAGCNPRTATDIAFHKWHLNGVKDSTRLEIATRGYELGHKYPEYRRRFQEVMK